MRLAKLTISGFKSFADKTEFTFGCPITAVVGPNGCGKSNIVDAVKWVLGERSAKSLRGGQMLDVIFAGTVSRKPMGRAEVVLTFENPVNDPETGKRDLPVDSDFVSVARRLYRDGTSQYLINDKKCRLRDVLDLFMDTGVGTDAYSVIEQGKVDAMLTANPRDRRSIFDEAAGIAKFKARRIEAQRKLEKAENNLLLCRQQIESTERRLRIVHGQAAKARKFRELDLEYRSLRTAHVLEEYADLEARLAGLTSRLRGLEKDRRSAAAELEKLEELKQQKELERHHAVEKYHDLEQRISECTHQRVNALQRLEMNRQANAELQEQLAEVESQLHVIEQKRSRLRNDLEDAAAQLKILQQKSVEAEKAVNIATAQKLQAQQQLSEADAKVSQKRAVVSDIERRLVMKEGVKQNLQHRTEMIRQQGEKLFARISELEEEINKKQDLARNARQAEQQAEQQIAGLSEELASIDAQTQEVSTQLAGLADRLTENEHERVRLDTRRHTLQEMQEAREGVRDDVKAVLDLKLPFVRGLLADHIQTDVNRAALVEAALGGALQSLLVDSLDDIDTEMLKDLPGRVTFIPADANNGSSVNIKESPYVFLPQEVVPLRPAVQAAPRFRKVIDKLLSRCVATRDLATARKLAKGPLKGYRFVTYNGEVLDPHGRITAGPVAAESGLGILQRKTELKQLDKALKELDHRISSISEQVASLDTNAGRLQAEAADLRGRIQNITHARLDQHSLAERLDSEVKRLKHEVSHISNEQEEITSQISIYTREASQLDEEIASLRRLHEEEKAVVTELVSAIKLLAENVEAAGEKLTTSRVLLGQLDEQVAAADKEVRQYILAIEDTEQQLDAQKRQFEIARKRRMEHDRVIDEATFEIEELEQKLNNLNGELEPLRNKAEQCTADTEYLGEQLLEARKQFSIIERDWHALEVSKRELEVRRENLEFRTIEELEVDLPVLHIEYIRMMADGDVLPLDAEQAVKEIEELREQIRKLGNVNLDAIREEEELEKRNEDLIAQLADIDNARKSLEELIRQLNEASIDRFRKTFEMVERNFAGKDGMFRKLFGGGRAEIRLIPEENGEIDWLESGIEIIAKPPGKEPRSITLLSGGERTMTAVALLMAIMRSRPSPFCILDEVEAALDDANVDRFCRALEPFLEKSHFILITHNKRSMQAADQLYGVTMQERGVSRRVKVKLSDIRENGEIDQKALKENEKIPAEKTESRRKSLREELADMRSHENPIEI